MQHYEKPIRSLMHDMANELASKPGQSFTKQQAINWFAEQYGKIKKGAITAHLVRLSTNVPYRYNYNPKPGEDDLFFRIDPSHFRLYDPKQDPPPIYSPIHEDGKKQAKDEEEEPEVSTEFAYESDLRNYLAKNLSVIELGLKLYEDEGLTGKEFPVGGRFIDILAVSPKGDFVVIELKVSRGYDRVVGQLMRYMAWIRKNLAEAGHKVRGVIVAREISEDLLLACSEIQNVQLFEYELSLALKRLDLEAGT